MLVALLLAQLAVAQDTTYSSNAVRDLVSRAAVSNHAPPPALSGYHAHVESELSLLLRDSLGRERAAQIEQLASAIAWQRSGAYDMHVVGYRMQTLGSPVSTLSFVRGWTEPTLYGERLRIGVQLLPDSAPRRAASDTAGRDSIQAFIHSRTIESGSTHIPAATPSPYCAPDRARSRWSAFAFIHTSVAKHGSRPSTARLISTPSARRSCACVASSWSSVSERPDDACSRACRGSSAWRMWNSSTRK